MKKTIAIVLMAIATSVFGSQQTQADEARARRIAEVQRDRARRIAEVQRDRVRHIAELQRARAERIKREIERAGRPERFEISKIYYQASAEANERNIKAIMDLKKRILDGNIFKTPYYNCKQTPYNCPQTPTKVKQKKPRNSLRSYDTRRENNRFETSSPAHRRK